MATPTPPTVDSLVTEGLRRGGFINPTAVQVDNAMEHAFREVKADIGIVAPDHPILRTMKLQPVTVGKSRYDWPSDAHAIRACYLLDGSDDLRGAAQAGGSSTITLASTFSKTLQDVQGKMIVILTGTAIGQYRQVIGYDAGTKIATVDTSWTTNPVAGDQYCIATGIRRLWPLEEADYFQRGSLLYWGFTGTVWTTTAPTGAMLQGREIWLSHAPDRAYGLLINYYADLDRLDEEGTLFQRCLRDWRSVWVYGVASKSMEGYDLDKASLKHGAKFPNLTQLQGRYQDLLMGLGAQSCSITQVVYTDL